MWENWIIDASMSDYDNRRDWCFCPVEMGDDGSINNVVLGMNMIGLCPGNLIGVFHPDGQDAAKQWCVEHPNWNQVVESARD